MLQRSIALVIVNPLSAKRIAMTPQQILKLNAAYMKLMIDTQMVMTLRVLGIAGAIRSAPDENERMIAEKGPAFTEAMTALTTAALSGSRPDQIIAAGMKPLQRKVSSNKARLSR